MWTPPLFAGTDWPHFSATGDINGVSGDAGGAAAWRLEPASGCGGCDQAAPGPEGAERLAPAPRVGPARWAGSFGFPPTLRPALVVAAGCPSVDAD